MTLDTMFSGASSIMTVLSLLTFLGIVWWSWSAKRGPDFAQAAMLPFADSAVDGDGTGGGDSGGDSGGTTQARQAATEARHG